MTPSVIVRMILNGCFPGTNGLAINPTIKPVRSQLSKEIMPVTPELFINTHR